MNVTVSTVTQLARETGLSYVTILRHIRVGVLKAENIGSPLIPRYLIPQAEAKRYIKAVREKKHLQAVS